MKLKDILSSSDLHIDSARLAVRLGELGRIGWSSSGMNSLAYTKEDNLTYDMVEQYMITAGLSVRRDAAGNLVGRLEGTKKLPAVLCGSHLDSVYDGGIYDGRLGVLGAIEALQVIHDLGLKPLHPIEVRAYRNEESCRFNPSISGAKMITSQIDPQSLESFDRDGISFRGALEQCGIDPEKLGSTILTSKDVKAHLELHIEQGDQLASAGLPVAVVTGITTMKRGEITLVGKASHAGATPMNSRFDALCGAAEIILAAEKLAAESSGVVATVGKVQVLPGGINIIPGEVRFSFDIRHPSPKVRDQLFENLRQKAEAVSIRRGLGFSFELWQSEEQELLCDLEIQDLIASLLPALGVEQLRLSSGAGHDSSSFMNLCPVGMIFVRSRNGSHNNLEFASAYDCALGSELLLRSLLVLAEVS